MSDKEMLMFVVGSLAPGFVMAWLATWGMRIMAPRWGLLDKPNARKVHLVPTPLGGGVAIWLGVVVTFLIGTCALLYVLTLPPEQQAKLVPAVAVNHLNGLASRLGSLWILLACGSILAVTGLIDDRFGLDWRPRLAIQVGVALFCVVTQGWRLTAFIELPQLGMIVSVALSTMWIVGLINSFNMLDNMDGLSGGVAVIAAGILSAVMLMAPDPETQRPQLFVAGFLLVLCGSIGGFLLHNRPPARIFMGDAGSYFIGFSIAIATLLATYTSYRSPTPHAVLAPLYAMAVPLYDMITVLWIRLRNGRSLFQADKNHFSHRLVDLGLSKVQAVLTIYLLSAACGVGALLLHRVDFVGACMITLMIVCVLLVIVVLESSARRTINDRQG